MNSDRAQMAEALAKANTVRLERSAIRRRIRTAGSYDQGRRLLAQLLSCPTPDSLASLPARQLLGWVVRMPKDTVVRMLTAAGASEHTLTGALTSRQRDELARLLRGNSETLRAAEDDKEFARWARSG